MPAPFLSIAIPTFNRCGPLRDTLMSLSSQLDERTELVIVDNCSTDQTADVVASFVARYPERDIRYVRNGCNVGASANVLRCIEFSRGDWVWVLGDDDQPEAHCVELILERCERFPTAFAINFETNLSRGQEGPRDTARSSHSFDELVANIKSFGNFLFLGSTVLRREKLLPFIARAYHYTSSYGPHVALLLEAARSGGAFEHLFTTGVVCTWVPNTRDDKWNPQHVHLGLQRLVDIPDRARQKKLLSELIAQHPTFDHRWLLGQRFASADDLLEQLADKLNCVFVRSFSQGFPVLFAYVLLTKTAVSRYPILRFPVFLSDSLLGLGRRVRLLLKGGLPQRTD